MIHTKGKNMKRYAIEYLKRWKTSPDRKPMILHGARQVGKTWLAKEFGKTCYENVAYVSFYDNDIAKKIFEQGYDVAKLIPALESITNTRIIPGKTLIILDEIQECEHALNSLKYFNENAPEYHILVTGSMLGVAVKHEHLSFPVGQVDFLTLYPLGFAEFLEATGNEMLAENLLKGDTSVLKILHSAYIPLLKQYMFVGGMPEAVKQFAKTNNYADVRKIHKEILAGHERDFSKYTESFNVAKISAVWNSIPAQFAKEQSNFTYTTVDKNARGRTYSDAIEWLYLCGLIYKIPKISVPNLPLPAYYDNRAFKIYMLDIGLLCAKAELPATAIIDDETIFKEFKGALAEQYVLQEMKLLPKMPIGYWESKGKAEVDFIIQRNSQVMPIEVKASTNIRAKSLKVYREKYTPKYSVRTSLAEFEINDGLYNIPLYLISQLNNIIPND